MCGVYPTADALDAGTEISSTYEGRHVTLLESEMTHPTHADGFVDKGDAVVFGDAVGVAFKSAAAATDLIAIDTEGIWIIDVYAADDSGNSAVVPGDRLFINTSTCAVSKITNVATQIPFGYALGSIDAGNTNTIAVKVHHDPNYENDLQIFKTIDVASPGTFAAAMKLTVNSDIAQTGTRMCALSVNLEPGSGLQAQQITGAEVCTYLAADIPVAGVLTGLFVETQGGLSYASDVHSLYVYLAMNADPGTHADIVRLEHNSGTATWLDYFISFIGDGQYVFDFGPNDNINAWAKDTAPNGAAVGILNVMVGSTAMQIPLHLAP